MTDLLELAARCEAAEGPDRELDMLIWRALDPVNASHCLDNGNKPLPWLWQFTASLDAALTLVPEGWHYSGCDTSSEGHKWGLSEWDGERIATARAATPALALCAAALRARSASHAD